MITNLPPIELLSPAELIAPENQYFHLDVFGKQHKSINEVNNWPIEYKQNITLMLHVANYLIHQRIGAIKYRSINLITHKIYVKLVVNGVKRKIAIVKKNRVSWCKNTLTIKLQYNPKDLIANEMQNLLTEANNNVT